MITVDAANLLGEVVTWDVNCRGITLTTVKSALSGAGLNPDEATELSMRSAFSRACKDLKKNRAIDKLSSKNGVAEFQLTRKVVSDDHIDYDYETKISLDLDSGKLSCSDTHLEKMAQVLLNDAIEARNAQDITRLVQGLFQKNADLWPINPKKGVAYFVPETHRVFTAKVDDFLKRLGGKLSRFPVPKGTAEGNASVQDAVKNGLQTLIDELNGTVASWDTTTRKNTTKKAIAQWEKIQYKVDAYADYLEAERDNLNAALAQAKADLANKILTLEAEKKAADEAEEDDEAEESNPFVAEEEEDEAEIEENELATA